MFKSVRVKNFRAITDLQVDDLGRVNLFVGHNACGKTTLLESVLFLAGSTSPHLLVSANSRRALPSVKQPLWSTYFHDMHVDVPIEIVGRRFDGSQEEQLVIRPRYEAYRVNEDDPELRISGELATTGLELRGQVIGLRLEYTDSADSTRHGVSEVVLRGSEMMAVSSAESPLERGAFVGPCANDWREPFSEVQKHKRVGEVIGLLREIEPKLDDLRQVDPPGLLYADVGAPKLIPVKLMGGGMAKFLSIALAMLTPNKSFVLIDEIENGLDYISQQKLWAAILSWAQKLNIQVFASTHSRECIKAFNDCAEGGLFASDAKLFRIERKDDQSRVVEYTPDLIAESLESDWEIR